MSDARPQQPGREPQHPGAVPAPAAARMAGRGRLALLLYACLLPWPLSGWWVEADAGLVDGLTATGAESSWLWAALGVMVGLYGQVQDRAAVDPDIR